MEVSDLAYINENGFFFADYPSFLQYVTDGYLNIYGQDTYVDPDSMDGQLLAFFAKALYDSAARDASTYNSFSPVTAQGVGLSRNVKINGLERENNTFSTVDLVIVGQVGTTITNGSAKDILGQIWNLPASVVIPISGTITVTATAAIEGAISANSNTVTTINTPTLGWQTVNNPSAASVGVPTETDAELRIRQAQSTANPAQTLLNGTEGAIANLAGVEMVRGYENDTGTTDGNGIPAHSISLVVEGGDAMAIAQAIQIRKTPGTSTYGTTSETVYDSKGMPLIINFFRPTLATIGVHITLVPGPAYTSDYDALIKASVAAAIDSFGIGKNIIYNQLFAAAYLVGNPAGMTYTITAMTINKNAGGYAAADVSIAFNELGTCNPSTDVVVTP